MTILITIPEVDVREELATPNTTKINRRAVQEEDGNSVLVDFEIKTGWQPVAVYVAGARQRQGAGEAYIVTFDGYIYTVTFATAPGSVNIDIDIELVE